MSGGWETRKLSEVCEHITDGTHQTPKYFDNGIVFLSSRNVKSELIDWENIKYIDQAQHVEMHKRVAPRRGDILLAKNGTTGVAAMVDRDTTFDIYVSLALLRALPPLDSNYLLYFVNSPLAKKQFNKRLKGVGVPNLHLKEIREVQISFPTELSEQKRIVAILDEAFGAIARAKENAARNLANARELFDSYLNRVFSEKGEGWEETTVEDVCQIVNGFAFKSRDFSSDNPVNSIKITNVGVREFVEDTSSRLPQEFAEEFDKVAIPSGSMVIALTRTIISDGLKVAIVPAEFHKALLNQRVAGLLFQGNDSKRDCVYFYFQTHLVSDYVMEKANTLMQPNLSITDLRTMPLPIPISKDSQLQLVQRLNTCKHELKRLEKCYQTKIKDLDELKQSLLQKAFTGQLTSKTKELELVP